MNPTPAISPAKRLTDGRFLNLFQADVQRNDGWHPWVFASRRSDPLTGPLRADAVAMVIVVTVGGENRLLVTREFRVPLGRFELALPSGLVDEGETLETAASRELREETGLILTRIALVSPPLASSAGLTDETVCLVYGEASGEISKEHLEQHEEIEARLMSLTEIRQLLARPGDDVISARLYAALVGFTTSGVISLPRGFEN